MYYASHVGAIYIILFYFQLNLSLNINVGGTCVYGSIVYVELGLPVTILQWDVINKVPALSGLEQIRPLKSVILEFTGNPYS